MKKAVYNSPLGNIVIEMEGRCLTGLYFSDETALSNSNNNDKALRKVALWLDGYFSGKNKTADFQINQKGTPFQRAVWAELEQIPYGTTCTYGQISSQLAARLGKQKVSPRAVGRAVGCNKIAIIIPCHRVIGTNGKLTGYAWGLERKEKLLKFEKHCRDQFDL